MNTASIPMLPVKNFGFPIRSPRMTMIKCIRAMARFDDKGDRPVVLRRESLSNAAYIIKAMAELCKRAEIDDSEWRSIRSGLENPTLWNSKPIDIKCFCSLLKDIEAFTKKHKKGLGEVYRQDKEFFNDLYKKSVLKRKVLVVHSKDDSPDALVKTLSTGCYYDVDVAMASATVERSLNHHLTIFLCSDPKNASEVFKRSKKLGIEIFLTDLGKKLPVFNMDLCRIVNQAQQSGIKFIHPPYVTMKILPAMEELYVSRLEMFDKIIATQEESMLKADETLFKGMEEAQIYAELIVEEHWKQKEGYSMEQAVFNSLW